MAAATNDITDVQDEFSLWLESRIHSTGMCRCIGVHFGERFHSTTGAQTGLSITGALNEHNHYHRFIKTGASSLRLRPRLFSRWQKSISLTHRYNHMSIAVVILVSTWKRCGGTALPAFCRPNQRTKEKILWNLVHSVASVHGTTRRSKRISNLRTTKDPSTNSMYSAASNLVLQLMWCTEFQLVRWLCNTDFLSHGGHVNLQ